MHLKYSLRTPKILSEKIKGSLVKNNLHKNNSNIELFVTENMPLGPPPLILKRSQGSYHERLQLAFSEVKLDRPALIILDWSDMKHQMKSRVPRQQLSIRIWQTTSMVQCKIR